MIPLTAKFLDGLHVLQGLGRGLQPLVLGLHDGAVVLGHGFSHLNDLVINDDNDDDTKPFPIPMTYQSRLY